VGLDKRELLPLVFSEADMDAAKNQQGKSLREALSEAGYAGRPRVTLDPNRHVAYLEGHIEQGPRLETEGKKIGVVMGIVGIRRCHVTCTGQADHAGTTPMHLRKDAGSTLIKCCHDLMQRFEHVRGPNSVWNFGHIMFEPGAGNVVPSTARVLVEFRDVSEATLDRMQAEIASAAAAANGHGGVGVQATELIRISPAEMDPDAVRDSTGEFQPSIRPLPRRIVFCRRSSNASMSSPCRVRKMRASRS